MCDKPMECSKCKREGVVFYQEIKDGKTTKYTMCKSCPLLKSKLYTDSEQKEETSSIFNSESCKCPVCGLTSDEFTITLTLGCDTCAKTFKDIITKEILSQNLLPKNVKDRSESNLDTFHFGKIPEIEKSSTFSKKVETLHVALNEAIESEHFEDAADIRDQIQQYLENPNAGTK